MGKENKKLRNSKNNTLREELTRDPDLMLLIERAVIRCINDDVAVTINGIARDVNMDTDIVRQMLPSFTEIRDHRIELRCTYEEKRRWEKKAKNAKVTVSRLASQSLTKLKIVISPAETLRDTINNLIAQQTGFYNNFNQLVKWCNSHKGDVNLLFILCELRELEKQHREQVDKVNEMLSPQLTQPSRVIRHDKSDTATPDTTWSHSGEDDEDAVEVNPALIESEYEEHELWR